MTLSVVDLLTRLSLAAVLGAVVGFEREAAGRGAGARTHALVALGSALFTLAGAYGFADVDAPNSDPARVAAQVATGVGFIGAGAILRNGANVLGLTTASAVWMSAAVGVTAAAGAYVAAAIATGLTIVLLIVLNLLKPVFRRFVSQRSTVEMEYERGSGTLGPVLRALNEAGAHIDSVSIEDRDGDGRDVVDLDAATVLPGRGLRRVVIDVSVPRRVSLHDVLGDMAGRRDEVRSMRIVENL